MTERSNEKYARNLVSQALGVPVDRYEDGLAPSQVDALIRFPSEDAALEIISNHDSEFNAQWNALEKIGHEMFISGLAGRWAIQLARWAKIRTVRRRLPALLRGIDEAGELRENLRGRQLPHSLTAIGVLALHRIISEPDGKVSLSVEGWSGTANGAGDVVPRWVEQVLAIQSDVPAKLKAHPAAQKHVFIWTTIGSDYGVQFQLKNQDGPLPTDAPVLPDGVTHIWVAGSFTNQEFMAWFPERGWWRMSRE